MKIEPRKISQLVAPEYNPRRITKKQFEDLNKSFENLGTLEPAVINTFPGRENIIISGNQRIKVAKSRGMKEYPCLMVSFSPEKEKEANIRLNRNTGEWDFDLLSNEFELNDLIAWGFEPEEIGIDTDVIGIEGLTDPDDVPETPKEAKSKPGDLYILGRHRLLCGDATKISDVEKLMDGKLADLIITDPPYNVGYEGKTKDAMKIENDAMSDQEFSDFLRSAYASYFSAAKPGAGIYVFHADMEGANFRLRLKESGFLFKQVCIWVKNSLVMSRQDFHWKHEPILYGWKEGAAHNWHTDRKQTTVWEFDRPSRNGDHPTMKPVDLLCYPMECSSKPGGIVIDFFGGSGSTLIACEKIGRTCNIMEIDPKYCDVIVRRWEEFTGLKAKLSKA